MAVSSGSVVCVMMVLGYLSFQTFLLLNFGHQLNECLKRIEDLEGLLENATQTKPCSLTTRNVDDLEKMLNSEPRANNNAIVKLLQRLKRMRKSGRRASKSKSKRSKRNPRKPFNTCDKKRYAVFTSWGTNKCPGRSQKIDNGQMVTTDGSDYFCLSDGPEGRTPRVAKTPGRSLGSSVDLRGVTYGDIEDVLSLNVVAPSGMNSRNNESVPCAVCARCGKSSSAVLSAIETKLRKFSYIERAYRGVLMSTKESKKFICLNVDSERYHDVSLTSPRNSRSNAVKIHPAELRCNSLYCDHSAYYKEGYRVACLVVTF